MEITLKMAYLPDDDGIVRPKYADFGYKYSDFLQEINKKEILFLYMGVPNLSNDPEEKIKLLGYDKEKIGEMIEFYPEKFEAKFKIYNQYENIDFSKYTIGLVGYYNKLLTGDDINKRYLVYFSNNKEYTDIKGFQLLDSYYVVIKNKNDYYKKEE